MMEELQDSELPVKQEQVEDVLEDGLDDSLEEIEEDKQPKQEAPKDVSNKAPKVKSNRRTYKISITYDFYYNTPRLWIQGTDDSNKPLSEAEIYDDIMSDYKGKTVTMETHPHLGNIKALFLLRRLFFIKKNIETNSK